MRALVIDDTARDEVKRVTDFADRPENFYIVGAGGFSFQRPPGDDSRHVAHLNSYRCVYSTTKADGKLWRHLSISIPGSKYPHPVAAFAIAELFGFTGWDGIAEHPPTGWQSQVHEMEHCIVLAQERP